MKLSPWSLVPMAVMAMAFDLQTSAVARAQPPTAAASSSGTDPIALGSRWELFVDDYLIERLEGRAQQRLHRPEPRNVALLTDRPWEGNSCHYRTVFRDGDVVKMYYQCGHHIVPGVAESSRQQPVKSVLCYAESPDGVTFTRPSLNLYEFNGSTDNNILFDGDVFKNHGITIAESGVSVFKDTHPDCPAAAWYKAVAIARKPGMRDHAGLVMLQSADRLRWSLMDAEPRITDGRFDSQNLAFYDAVRGEYRAYHRDTHRGLRGIKTETSKDFLNWSEPRFLDYGDAPAQALYTNQVQPYYRAPHLLVGFPLRYIDRGWSHAMQSLPGLEQRRLRANIAPRYGTALTDALFMASRDGLHFKLWDEAFIRPRGGEGNWVYGDNSIAWGLVETPPSIETGHPELSLYATEGCWVGESMNVRRYAIRPDGFVSVHAPASGGEVLTHPVTFTGDQLRLNFSTSAAGSVQVELLDAGGKPIPGFAATGCPPLFGDHLSHTVHWTGGADVSSLQNQIVQIRFVLKDADLFAFGFSHTGDAP